MIVQKAKGVFEPREVSLGVTGGVFTQVRQGVRAGGVLVTSSQFLIDSESNLKEAIRKMLTAEPGTDDAPPSSGPTPIHQH